MSTEVDGPLFEEEWGSGEGDAAAAVAGAGPDLGDSGLGDSNADLGAPASIIAVSVALVESEAPIRDALARHLGDGVTPFTTIEELAGRLVPSEPAVVVMGPSCSGTGELAIVERLLEGNPQVGAVLVVDELTTNVLQQALRSGVKDVLTVNTDPAQLIEAVQRVGVNVDTAAAKAPVAEAPIEEDPDQPNVGGRVITAFSTKGGTGKSVIACNLGVSLAQRSDLPVCLVDADLQFGDVAVMLKLTPHHTIVDAVSSLDKLDAALLESLLVVHEPSGLLVLPAPLEPAFADQVGATEMVRIIELLRTFCGHVIVDTPAYFNDVVLGLVEVSDDLVLVAGMDIPSIKNVKIGLQTLRLLNTPMDKVRLLLNRSNSKVKLDISEVERTLQIQADILIPSDVVVPQSVNKGVPVVLHAPRAGVSKALGKLADLYVPAGVSGKKSRK
jgi:pilus assembly protein CpaE